MKTIYTWFLLFLVFCVHAQEKSEYVFIVTTDGFRWQEVFEGADSVLLHNPKFVSDLELTKQMYWDPSPAERRKKLMPFFWSVIAKQGQLYGNRAKRSLVNVKNMYKISYPGYNELLTGYPDPLPFLNAPQSNRNVNVLSYLNTLPQYKTRVVAFTSWNVFPYILRKRAGELQQNCGYELLNETGSEAIDLANDVQDSVEHKYKTRYDLLTFFTAKEYLKKHHPKVAFISFGETDEYAHQGRYDLYLQQANQFDRMLSELWYWIQTDSIYKNKTTLVLSTDHGRGKYGDKWMVHHTLIRGSGEIWIGLLGKGIAPLGEMESTQPVFQNQLAATVTGLLGLPFISNRKIGKALPIEGQTVKATPSTHDQQAVTWVAEK